MVELVVVLIGQVGRLAHPGGVGIVYHIVLFGFHLFAVFPLFLLAECNLHRQELAVFLQQSFDGRILQVLLEFIVDVQHDVRTPLRFDGVLHHILRRTVAAPMHGLCVLFVRLRVDFHLVRYHKRAVETQSEVSDDSFCFVLIFIDKLLRTREGNLVDVFIHLFGGHTDTVVLYGQGVFVFVYQHAHPCVA